MKESKKLKYISFIFEFILIILIKILESGPSIREALISKSILLEFQSSDLLFLPYNLHLSSSNCSIKFNYLLFSPLLLSSPLLSSSLLFSSPFSSSPLLPSYSLLFSPLLSSSLLSSSLLSLLFICFPFS